MALYILGFIIFIAGVAWALVTAGVPSTWVAISAVILLGIGLFTGATRMRSRGGRPY